MPRSCGVGCTGMWPWPTVSSLLCSLMPSAGFLYSWSNSSLCQKLRYQVSVFVQKQQKSRGNFTWHILIRQSVIKVIYVYISPATVCVHYLSLQQIGKKLYRKKTKVLSFIFLRNHHVVGCDLHPPHQQCLKSHPVHADHQFLQRAGGAFMVPLAETTKAQTGP